MAASNRERSIKSAIRRQKHVTLFRHLGATVALCKNYLLLLDFHFRTFAQNLFAFNMVATAKLLEGRHALITGASRSAVMPMLQCTQLLVRLIRLWMKTYGGSRPQQSTAANRGFVACRGIGKGIAIGFAEEGD